MIGRLFSSFSRPVVEGEEQLPNVPVSMLDEADTRNLLYGPANICTRDNRLDSSRDIRIVVLTDYKACDAVLFDSALEQRHTSPLGPGGSVGGAEPSSLKNSLTSIAPLSHGFQSNEARPPASPLPCNRSFSYSSVRPGSNGNISQNQNQQLPTTASGAYFYKYRDAPEVIPYALLKNTVFGHTTPLFTAPIVKLHPLPNDDMNHNRHLISLEFKVTIPNPNFTASAYNSVASTSLSTSASASLGATSLDATTHSSKAHNGPTVFDNQTADDANDSGSSWHPKSLFNLNTRTKSKSKTNLSSGSGGKKGLPEAATLSVCCGICIFLNTPKSNPDIIQNHWREIILALAELYSTISPRLEVFLSSLKSVSTGPSLYRPRFSVSHDRLLISASEKFTYRIMASLRTPRVLCGQGRWPELFNLLQWAVPRFEGADSESNFIGAMIAYFILHNKRLLRQEYDYGADMPIRTVLVASNRIFARKLLFILTSLIHDRNVASIAADQQEHHPDISMSTALPSPNLGSYVSSDSLSSVNSSFPIYFSSSDHGWEIPTASGAKVIAEPSSPYAVPFMVRSHESPVQSLSKSLNRNSSRSLLNSIDEAYRSFTSSGGSLFSSISGRSADSTDWSPDESDFDDNFVDFDGFLNSSSEDSPKRPGLSRMSSTERTSSSLQTYKDAQSMHLDKNLEEPAVKYTLKVTSSNDDNDGDILDVMIDDWTDSHRHQHTLPPIVGHIAEFHPDFIIQACPLTKDLEERISQTMFNDAKTWSTEKEPESKLESRVVSRTLIIHLRKREIYEWALVETEPPPIGDTGKLADQLEGTQHRLVQTKVYPSKKAAADSRESACRSLTNELKVLLNLDSTKDQNGTSLHDNEIEALKSAYSSFFGFDLNTN